MKHLRIRKSQLLVTTYYLQISWHYMKLELTLGMIFVKWSWSMIFLSWSHDFFENQILVCKLYTLSLRNLLRSILNFITCVEVEISSKKLHTRKYFHVTTIMMSSINPIYPGIFSVQVSNWYCVRGLKNNMY